jgi:hypothetical protein
MQITHTDWGLNLICPDAAGMFYDSSIEISQGTLSKIADEGFHLSGGKWMHDSRFCDAEANNPHGCIEAAVVGHRGPITILNDADHEWRVYCTGGGYVAQGDGEGKMLVIGDKWVDIQGIGDYGDIALSIVATAKIQVNPKFSPPPVTPRSSHP